MIKTVINLKPQSTWYNSGLRVVFAFNMNRQPLCPAASLFWLSRQRFVTTSWYPETSEVTPGFRAVWKTWGWLRGEGVNQQGGRHNGSEGGVGGSCSLTLSFTSRTDTVVRLTVQLHRRADTQTGLISLWQEEPGWLSQLSRVKEWRSGNTVK